MRRPSRPSRAPVARPPLDAAVEAMRSPVARAVLEPTSLSERAARVLALGPRDALTLMREVCRLDRLKTDAAARMAEVLLGARSDFVQLDDDRWALVVDGRAILTAQHLLTVEGGAVDRGRIPAGLPESDAREGENAEGETADVALVGHGPSNDPLALRTLRFAVVDVETTGSRAATFDRVTEIAIVPVCGGTVGEPWQQLVHPGRAIPPMITALTGISNGMVADAPRFDEIADAVCARLDGQVFTAHNAAFDWGFVDHELLRARRTRLTGGTLCTVRLARRLVPTLSRRSLDRVCDYFGVRIEGRHRAGGDAVATAQVLVRLLEIAEDTGVDTWPALQQYLRSSTRRSPRRSAMPTNVQEDTSA